MYAILYGSIGQDFAEQLTESVISGLSQWSRKTYIFQSLRLQVNETKINYQENIFRFYKIFWEINDILKAEFHC